MSSRRRVALLAVALSVAVAAAAVIGFQSSPGRIAPPRTAVDESAPTVAMQVGCDSSPRGCINTLGPATPESVDAFHFLLQSTFGPRDGEVAALLAKRDQVPDAYAAWIDEQLAMVPTLQLPALQQASTKEPGGLNRLRQETWFLNVMTAPDQLRQRVAFALSQLLVVSQRNSGLALMPFAAADYYDMLARNAFGNFRTLLEDVTLHPAMGVYLNMLGNRKPDPANNIHPDENYARELMQLFSIGLVQLDPDGTVRLDPDGVPVPTYDQSVVEGFAGVFTGWNYSGSGSFATAKRTNSNQVLPMQAYAEQHATGSKQLLSYPGAVSPELPPGQSAEKDLSDALDNVFHHPNVAPFVSGQLIQRLVTSNPSTAYVARVSSVFEDDGAGQRGNLGAVVKAILLDPEARSGGSSDVSGKIKEPLLRLIQLWRAYDAKAANGRYTLLDADQIFGQGPLLSPSVFNFFSPFYAPPGEIADSDLVSPEMQISTEYFNTTVTNYFYTQIFNENSTLRNSARSIVIDVSDEVAVAGNPTAVVDLVAGKLLGGVISPALTARAVSLASNVRGTKATTRALETIYLIATSPEFAAQR